MSKTPKMKEHLNRKKITIKQVILIGENGKEKNGEYYVGYASVITKDSQPFHTTIAHVHACTIRAVFDELAGKIRSFDRENAPK